MRVLTRYLLRNNLFYMCVCLFAGAGIYLLIDLLDRLDNFMEAGLGPLVILEYLAVKLPLIISQILPAVFLVSLILQVSVMERSKELQALRAGGAPYFRLVVVFLVWSVFWSGVHLGFSQFLGVHGESRAYKIWSEQVRGRNMDNRTQEHVWFRANDAVVKLNEVIPKKEKGWGLTYYRLTDDGTSVGLIIWARAFNATGEKWTLTDVETMNPEGYVFDKREEMKMEIGQDIKAFAVMDRDAKPAQLSLWRLGEVISRLQASGSNVELLRTEWHAKISYAFSIVVMALTGLAVCTFGPNAYRNVAMGMVAAFVYYSVFVICTAAGEKGLWPPAAAAWTANIGLSLLAGGWLAWKGR